MMHDLDATRTMLIPRPFVTLSYAQTLDGRLATSTGGSQWISAPESLHFSHKLRAKHDAILVGVGTARKDDPRLTVRLVAGRNPLRVVVDSTLRIPLTAAVLTEEAAPGTVLAVTERAPAARRDEVRALGATVLCLPTNTEGRVDLFALLAALQDRGVGSVLVEGGAGMITALLRARLVDRVVVCVAPKILGAGIEAVGDLGIRELARTLIMVDASVTPCGVDLILDGRVEYPGSPLMTVGRGKGIGCATVS
jgi:diaminohydroxyphosphoribosylaminopyrimidine deaminase / 5-amino-6-(5-phosphoribosylamino)uracil reductase